jgi:hypothetical protein
VRAFAPRADQQVHVSAMEQIEHTVGEDNRSVTVGAPPRRVGAAQDLCCRRERNIVAQNVPTALGEK